MFNRIRTQLDETFGWLWYRYKYPRIGKADIINALGQANGYHSFLEIATGTTGAYFADISSAIFPFPQRVLYNVPDNYDDDLPVHCTSSELSSTTCLQPLLDAGERFDVVFVDSYHSYEASKTDLEYGIKLLNPGGVMVVHDCNPPREELTSETFRERAWLGKTYLAFLDFVAQRPELEYCVVDTDWGVGLVFDPAAAPPRNPGQLPDKLIQEGLDIRDWRTFNRYRKQLLRLISVQEFFDRFVKS